MSEFDNALNNIKNMKYDDSFMEKTKKTIKGSAFGLVVGLMYGWYYQKNIYVSGILGAIGGGLINYALLGIKKDKNDE
jgi:hypothetical protein